MCRRSTRLTSCAPRPGEYHIELDGEALGIQLDADGDGQSGDMLVESLPVVRPGDIDFDDDVDTADLLEFLAGYTGPSDSPIPGVSIENGDLDVDGDVDTVDLLELMGLWTGAEAQAATDAAFAKLAGAAR